LPARAEWNHVVEITAAEAAALRRIPPLLSALRGLTPFALCQAGTIAGPTGAAVALLLTAASPCCPSLAADSEVSSPRNCRSTTSVVYFSMPLWSVYLRVSSRPSM
jgi:hypothetical protein